MKSVTFLIGEIKKSKREFIFHVLLILLGNPEVVKCNSFNRPSVKIVQSAYLNNENPDNKFILKLYTDSSYEFLNFKKRKEVKRVIRESGTYLYTKGRLVLYPLNGKIKFQHDLRFCLSEDSLFASNFLFKKKRTKQFNLKSDDVSKYLQPTFRDTVFGEIYNDFFSYDKLKPRKKIKVNSIDNMIRILQHPVFIESEDSLEKIVSKANAAFVNSQNYSNPYPVKLEDLKKLKVTIVVGHVDDITWQFVRDKEKLAKEMRNFGIQVVEVYPINTWIDVVEKSKNSDIFIYTGHGSLAGEKLGVDAGGICIDDGIWGYHDIKRDLKLKPNALVIFNHACFSAGSQKYDPADIGIEEAVRRVEAYAKPFIETNAGMYYATNINDLSSFIKYFMNGYSIGETYDKLKQKYGDEIRYRGKSKNNPLMEIAVSSSMVEWHELLNRKLKEDNMPGKLDIRMGYDMAYVGDPCYSIEKLLVNSSKKEGGKNKKGAK